MIHTAQGVKEGSLVSRVFGCCCKKSKRRGKQLLGEDSTTPLAHKSETSDFGIYWDDMETQKKFVGVR